MDVDLTYCYLFCPMFPSSTTISPDPSPVLYTSELGLVHAQAITIIACTYVPCSLKNAEALLAKPMSEWMEKFLLTLFKMHFLAGATAVAGTHRDIGACET